MEKIINQLKAVINLRESLADHIDIDDRKQGVPISQREAQTIIDSYDRLKAAFEKLLSAHEAKIFNELMRKETGLYYRKQAGLLPDQKKGGEDNG